MIHRETLPVIPDDRGDDLHNLESADSADLVLFMAGNQFMVMDSLIEAFKKQHPDIRRIYFETLPPGLELRQILSGGAVFRDDTITIYPDVYTSVNLTAMVRLQDTGHLTINPPRLYLHNRLVLMVPKGNPARIRSVSDLGQERIRISQPDPKNEDIAFHIIDMYRQAGGDRLVHRIMEEKRREGTTVLTRVHHRETPERIVKRSVDAGPVWATEVIHARSEGIEMDMVDPGPDLDQHERVNYYICRLDRAPNPENGDQFIDFITTRTARKIYERYGFLPPDL